MKKLIVCLLLSCIVFGAYIKPKALKWNASTEADLGGYLVYVVPASETLNYLSPSVEISKEITSYTLPGSFEITNGSYKLGLAAFDINGNISDITEVTYTFDFLFPNVPTGVMVADL